MIGLMRGADNPSVYTTTGIAVGVQAPPSCSEAAEEVRG
ncbi:MAG: hypothetical protein AVDCRST_MAG02-113 [uncultured Rubrobacteraceae bacterium]|uniref:Uncharacterized protein n=1 Tax=uncultured Rubrobacteraceae bacterium TaxID=349277 RepID=A0A6J4QME9_9ACTN|nr:MAG: hypothetical protein AVDCRST_MAG02-113 [uncultured Rubrobacteraceae bacterium]